MMPLELARLTVASRDPNVDAERQVHLGPAVVLAVAPAAPLAIRLADGRKVTARPAFALPYHATAGDELLVIGQGDAFYAIGVLQGRGQHAIDLPGDVRLRALDGTLTLSGDRGIEMETPALAMRASKLDMIVETVSQCLGSVTQFVRDRIAVQAGDSQVVVRESAQQIARNTVILSEDTSTLNAKKIQIG
jgi:hypothetical protein